MAQERPIRVAIIGGGCAGMTTAFELSRPEHDGKYEVSVFQRGFRLGGKGASSRGVHGRIEEHGLHVWMGYYENAFRLMRQCYAELGRDPEACPIASFEDAFRLANHVAAADQCADGSWVAWGVNFPITPGLPGDLDPHRKPPSLADYMRQLLRLARKLIQSASVALESEAVDPRNAFPLTTPTPEVLRASIQRFLQYGVLVGLGAVLEAMQMLELAFESSVPLPDNLLLKLLDAARGALQAELERYIAKRDDLRRVWAIADLLFASIRGTIRHRLLTHPRGLEAIDDYDCREWLLANGASRRSLQSAFVRALYDLAFAFEEGDPSRPRIAAGAGLRGFLRAFFTYRGAFFWKMNAGMGDIVFAPLYELLSRRGVRFEFFHSLRRVGLAQPRDGESPHVERLEFGLQARVRCGASYQPLRVVGGLPCFPDEPDYAQLEDADAVRAEPWTFESQPDARFVGERTLEVGRDFDLVVLAVGVGAVPAVCEEILARDARWRAMVEHVKTVPTKAFQIWLDADLTELGCNQPGASLSGFVDPFDTWADMTHLAGRECWPDSLGSIAYFCSVLRDDPAWAGRGGRQSAMRAVRDDAIRFMDGALLHLWPGARAKDTGFRWESLKSARSGHEAFDSQHWSANVDPSDRYVLSLPGSIKHRISPLDRTYDNLTIAGDWTECGLNLGCVEAAVMSGLLAAHAISESPRLEEIIGFDHP